MAERGGQGAFLRGLFVPVYLPAILFATGEGALIPVVPLTATALGANLAVAGIISGLLMIGVVIGDIPSSAVVARWGEEVAMRVAGVLAALAAVVCWAAPNLVVLAAGVLVVGIASATFNLARHSFLTTWTPTAYRARAMSLLGGTSRVGYFVGPFLAAPVIALWGSHSVYWLHVAACAAVLVALQVMPDPKTVLQRNRQATLDAGLTGPVPTPGAASRTQAASAAAAALGGPKPRPAIMEFFGILVRLGVPAGILQMMRASRQVILPLWGVHLGIPEASIALIVGVAGAVDLSLFYTSGQVMDRYGRRWVAVPVLTGLGLAHLVLPLAATEWGYIAVAILLSIANGMGSGIVMTLGSDHASRYAPGRMPAFLGSWRVFSDTGSAIGPLGISALTAAFGLPAAALAMGGCGLVGAVLMYRYIPRLLRPAVGGR